MTRARLAPSVSAQERAPIHLPRPLRDRGGERRFEASSPPLRPFAGEVARALSRVTEGAFALPTEIYLAFQRINENEFNAFYP